MPFLLISRSTEYELRLRRLLGDRLAVVPGEYLVFGPEGVADRVVNRPRIALLGPVLNYEETRSLVQELSARIPDLGIVVVREQRSDLEDWVDELSLHAVLSPDATDEATMALIERLSDWLITQGMAAATDFDVPALPDADEPAPEPEPKSADHEASDHAASDHAAEDEASADDTDAPAPAEPPVEVPELDRSVPSEAIAVVAPKGGQGKTTLAINLAAGLAEVAPNSVVLVDGDLQFGDITASLALDPEHTVVDAIAAVDDEMVLKTTLTHHAGGFFVVASAPSPEFADRLPPQAFGALVERLRALFRYVIVDTTPGLGEHSLAVLDHVTDAVFVMSMGVPALRAVRTEFELLEAVGLMPANRHVVLNFSDRQSGLAVKDVEHIIGAGVDVEVPRSPAVLLASNRGVPLIQDDVRDPAAKAVRSLVLRIAPDAYPKRRILHRKRGNA